MCFLRGNFALKREAAKLKRLDVLRNCLSNFRFAIDSDCSHVAIDWFLQGRLSKSLTMDTPPSNSDQRSAAAAMTPMMAQYFEVKQANPGSLLFYRMGDFYELFFDDAVEAARTLGIALTKRGKHLGDDIPMCGVPVHAMDHYLQKLIRHGHRVAVCEQLEDPVEAKKRGSKSVVKRDVVRLITPGTLTEDSLLDVRSTNHLSALVVLKSSGDMALAYADISTGDFAVTATTATRLAADMARIAPSEIVLADQLLGEETVKQALAMTTASPTPLPQSRFDSQTAELRLVQHFNVATTSGFAEFSRAEVAALGSLLDYILLTQIGAVPHLRVPRREAAGEGLLVDAATRANLELNRSLQGTRSGSLLEVMDRTVTSAGARRLAALLSRPLARADSINERLDGVDFFHGQEDLTQDVRETLSSIPDIERALARVTAKRASPRDLASLSTGIARAHSIASELARLPLPAVIGANIGVLVLAPLQLAYTLQSALGQSLPLLARDGGFIAPGYDGELDQSRKLRDDTRGVIAGLQARYSEVTGLKNLKIKHNNILGYFVEVPQAQADGLKDATGEITFFHRQTMAGAMRFSTAELASLEQKISHAADRALAIEMDLFEGFCQQVVEARADISSCAAALADLDCLSSLAHLARTQNHVRPVVDDGIGFIIKEGRHPVVEAALAKAGASRFIANDCHLGDADTALWLLTGPNMAGKSTFLRQNALIVVMAQMGAYVPASSAHIGVVDRLYSRVGAADDLARGRSTFMVEMVETAAILNQATPKSLVILDEIGRGTATFDGLSIAWAALEYLHEHNQSRALFATHYHELTSLQKSLSRLKCMTMAVKEWQGEIKFMHHVEEGAADRSYGIQAAKLAGLPQLVIARAQEVLAQLEEHRDQGSKPDLFADLPLFSVTPKAAPAPDHLRARMAALQPDNLSPREAHDMLYELKRLAQEDKQ
jgi:DNA mismatch repair protein MutS